MRSTVQRQSPNYQKYKTQEWIITKAKISNSFSVDKQEFFDRHDNTKTWIGQIGKNFLLSDYDILKIMLVVLKKKNLHWDERPTSESKEWMEKNTAVCSF